MLQIYRMRARQCRVAAERIEDHAKRVSLERIAQQWDALADQIAEARGGNSGNVIPFSRFARARAERLARENESPAQGATHSA